MEVFMRRSMHNFILYAKEKNISMSQMGTLFHLHRTGSCDVSEIGDEMGITNAAASQMLERLVQQDLIERSESPQDRRVKVIVLKEKGWKLLEEGIHARQNWLEDLARTLTDEEKAKVVDVLSLLIEKVHQLDKADETPHLRPY